MSYATQYIGKIIEVKIDRLLGSKHPKHNYHYPVNYGFIENTKAPDGEEIDAYTLGVFKPVDVFNGIVIAVIHRTNDDDDKLVLYIKESERFRAYYNGNCIVVEGNGFDLVKGVDRILYNLYNIMEQGEA